MARIRTVIISFLMLAASGVTYAIALQTQSAPAASLRTTPVAVGEVAPDFTLVDQRQQKFILSEARGKHPVVLVFYRGYW